METVTTTCDTCKAQLTWDEDTSAWLDRFDSEMCPFFDLEDVHTVLD